MNGSTRLFGTQVTLGAFALSTVLWVFGIATTASLISTWGRAVASDPVVIGAAARELATADAVVDRLLGEATEVALADGGGVGQAFADLVDHPVVVGAMEQLMSEVVTAASTSEGTGGIDVAGALAPVAPLIATEAERRGYEIDADAVERLIGSIEPIVVRTATQPPVVGVGSPTAGWLTVASALSVGAMFVSGWAAVRMADDRRAMLRSLLIRVMVSALSFAVIMRLGAWLADPDGGSTPMRSAVSVVAASHGWVPLAAAAIAGGSALGLWLLRRPQRARPNTEIDEPSGELPVLVSG